MSELRNIRLRVAYDGTDFSGWQRQEGRKTGGEPLERGGGTACQRGEGKGKRTVQGLIEGALEKMHQGPVALTGSGRTDAGVHAAGQVANFHTSIQTMDARRFAPALNSLLPQDVRVLEAQEAAPAFHARFDAKWRTYRYHFICGRPLFPQECRYALYLRRFPGIDRLNAYARLLWGEWDCSCFAHSQDSGVSRRRYIYGASFFMKRSFLGDTLVFEIRANAFLWKMVRAIAGTLIHAGERGISPQALRSLMGAGDRSRLGPTLPPQGLFLWNVAYYPTAKPLVS